MRGPLSGYRVLDAGAYIAGPYAGTVLAGLGADVVKVEPPGGDPARAYPPFVGGVSTLFAAVNQGKRYIALDLRSPEGRGDLERLLRVSDVVIHNMRSRAAAGLGLDAAPCHDVNARLVHCTIEGFHPDEPERPGYDLLMQAESGMMHLTGEAGRSPVRAPASVIDHMTGLWAATAILAALHGTRDRTSVSVSMLDVALGLLNEKVAAFLATGVEPQRMGSYTSVTTPHGAYRTADGDMVIGAASDSIFARLAAALGPPVSGDARFATQAGRLANREALDAAIHAVLAGAGTSHWLEALGGADVPVAVVRSLADAVERHRRASRSGMRDVVGLDVSLLALPVVVDGCETGPIPSPAPVGADTEAVLAELQPAPGRTARAAGGAA